MGRYAQPSEEQVLQVLADYLEWDRATFKRPAHMRDTDEARFPGLSAGEVARKLNNIAQIEAWGGYGFPPEQMTPPARREWFPVPAEYDSDSVEPVLRSLNKKGLIGVRKDFWSSSKVWFYPEQSGATRSNPSRKGINHYPWMKLSFALPFEALAEKRGAAKVARSYRGFFHAFKKAGGKGAKMGRTHKDTPNRGDSYMWWERRNEFISRHMAQVKKRGERLWKPNGEPTNRHLGLIMWAYTPDPESVLDWAKAKRNGFALPNSANPLSALLSDLEEARRQLDSGNYEYLSYPRVKAQLEAVDLYLTGKQNIHHEGHARQLVEEGRALVYLSDGGYSRLYLQWVEEGPLHGMDEGAALPRAIRQYRKAVQNPATDLEGRHIPEKYLRGLTPAERAQRIEELTASRSGTRYEELPTDKAARRKGLVRKGKYTKEAESRGVAHKSNYTDTARRALGYYRVRATDKNVKAVADALKKVWRKGMAAWKTGHRPGASQKAWAYARINSFLTGGKTVKVDKKEFAALPKKMRVGILAEA